MIDPDAETVEVVDRDGVVQRIVTRAEMRRHTLRHRATYIAVIRSNDRLVVHRRADWKDVNPGLWDIAFGGVAGVGDDWAQAAQRELAEEAGLADTALEEVGIGSYEEADGRIVARVFLARTDADIQPQDAEVVEVAEVALAELDAWRETVPLCPDSLALVLPYLQMLAGE